ncbi:MAG: dienelactone hydrolase family protein [Pseudomonadota bacterium]
MNERISIDTPDGSFGVYVARPTAGSAPAPAIVVIQEIFGINADMRAHCDALAAKGFIALCPDLFWRLEAGIELSDKTPEEWQQAMGLYKRFDLDKGVDDVAATLAAARALPGANGKVGVMGFCMGGLLTYLTAMRTGADAAVAYYGGRSEQFLGEMGGLPTPLMMHLGEADEYIPPPARQAIVSAAAAVPSVKIFTYPGQNHAFARVDGSHFNAGAAALANERTEAFFAEHLK